MKFFKAILNAFNFFKTNSQMEYYILSKQPQNHADLEHRQRQIEYRRSRSNDYWGACYEKN